jgi:hypothetical protein
MANTVNIDDFSSYINDALEKTLADLPEILDQKVLDAKAIIRNRFTQKGLMAGESGDEVSFPAYSDGYEKYKKRRYNPSTPNKLLLTGDMWRKINIIDRIKSDKNYTVVLGGSDAFSQDKIDWNSERYTDIFKVTKNEQQIITDVTSEEIINRFIEHIG